MRFTPRGRRGPRSHNVELNLVSMVDVIFQLIVFFMATAHLAFQARVELDLPSERGEGLPEVEITPIEVHVLADARPEYAIVGMPASLDEVLAVVDEEIARLVKAGRTPQDLDLTVRADRRGLTAAVNRLGLALQQRGVTRWRLAVQPQP